MAINYVKKEWENRETEYPDYRQLNPVNVDGTPNLFQVNKFEGAVIQEGDRFEKGTMDDLEERISKAFVDANDQDAALQISVQQAAADAAQAKVDASDAQDAAESAQQAVVDVAESVANLDATVVKSVDGAYPSNGNVSLKHASDDEYGIATGSADISFTDGRGTVRRSDTTEGLISTQLSGTLNDLNTLYGLGSSHLYWAGPGNTVSNKPSEIGTSGFGVYVQRISDGHSIQVLYASEHDEFSGLWTREWNGVSWSAWTNKLNELYEGGEEVIEVTNFVSDPNTWGFSTALTGAFIFKIWFQGTATNRPTGWGSVGGSGAYFRQDSTGSGTLIITRTASAAAGNAVELAFKSWNNTGAYWTPWRIFGSNLGGSINLFDATYTKTVTAAANTLSLLSNNYALLYNATSTTNKVFGPEQTASAQIDLGNSSMRWRNMRASGDIYADTSMTLGGQTITKWPMLTRKSFTDLSIPYNGLRGFSGNANADPDGDSTTQFRISTLDGYIMQVMVTYDQSTNNNGETQVVIPVVPFNEANRLRDYTGYYAGYWTDSSNTKWWILWVNNNQAAGINIIAVDIIYFPGTL